MTIRTRSNRADARRPWASGRALQALGRLAVAVLLLFHAWLLTLHVATGKLFEADVAARWVVAVAVFAAFAGLRRYGLSLFRDKRAAALWLLVMLIHCHAAWTGDAAAVVIAVPESVVELMSAGAQVAAALTALLFIVWLALQSGVRRRIPGTADLAFCFAGLPADAYALCFSPRPPPLA